MDFVSSLLQEARPLYLRRQHLRRTRLRAAGAMMVLAMAVGPIFMHNARDYGDIDSLYAELYSAGDGASGEYQTNYYIDEFDAIGVI